MLFRSLAYRALADHRTGFVGPSWTGSAGTSQLDLHGDGPKAAAGVRGEELRECSVFKFTRWRAVRLELRSRKQS